MSSRRIVRITKRFVSPMMEMRVREVMASVEKDIRKTKGLLRIETMVDKADPNRHVFITEWSSRKHLDQWLASDLHKDTVRRIETVLLKKVVAREFVRHEDDVFLL